jgi:hypothetical protein
MKSKIYTKEMLVEVVTKLLKKDKPLPPKIAKNLRQIAINSGGIPSTRGVELDKETLKLFKDNFKSFYNGFYEGTLVKKEKKVRVPKTETPSIFANEVIDDFSDANVTVHDWTFAPDPATEEEYEDSLEKGNELYLKSKVSEGLILVTGILGIILGVALTFSAANLVH